MNIELLRNECRKYGLRVSGTYKELTDRLKDYKTEIEHTSVSETYEYETHGRNIGADILITYGSLNIIGFYKKYGIKYDRPSYIKIDQNGKKLQNEKIYIYYNARLDQCGNYNNIMYKGNWIIGDNPLNSQIYYNICKNNDSFSIPLTDWDNQLNIVIL